MWRNYLTASIRAMSANRSHSLINIAGLAIGVAAAVLVFIYVRYENSYDRWLPDSDRIYQLQTRITVMGPEPVASAMAPRAAVVAMKREFPQIEQVVGLTERAVVTRARNDPISAQIIFVDGEFFDVFELPFVRGDRNNALRDPSSLVLTESEARRYFGDDNALGKTMEIEIGEQIRTLRVSGVVADLPANTHLDLALIARLDPAQDLPAAAGNWGMMDTFVYAKLRPDQDASDVNGRMPEFERRNLGSMNEAFDYHLSPISGIHLSPPLQGAMRPGGDPVAVQAFSIIGGLILLIAAFNFTNLATAQAGGRAREVGLRKALGAKRRQLITQFLFESMLFAGVGTLIGLALVEVLLPFFNAMLGVELSLAYLGSDGIVLPAIMLMILMTLVSGFYPAVYLSHFSPASVLKAATVPGGAGSARLRNALVLAQFAIATALVICAAVIYAQTRFARDADPGFRPRGLLVVENIWMPHVRPAAQALRERIAAIPGVSQSSLSGSSPTGDRHIVSGIRRPGAERSENVDSVSIDYGWLATMGVPILAGRDLSPKIRGDTLPQAASLVSRTPGSPVSEARFNILLNATAAQLLGFRDPQSALGHETIMPEGRATIVGVVGDSHFGSLREPPAATVYLRDEANFNYLIIRYAVADAAALNHEVQNIWRTVDAGTPYTAKFVEEVLASHYEADAVRGQVFSIAAFVSIAIACLGLFGLAAFVVERRKVEIAIRKVFGASDLDVVRLMMWQFSRPVLAANLIAWPVAWWWMRDWLNGFSQRIALHPVWFIAAAALILLLAIIAVSGHALRISRTAPAATLRYE